MAQKEGKSILVRVGKLLRLSINTISESFKAIKIFRFQHLSSKEQVKFHSVELTMKKSLQFIQVNTKTSATQIYYLLFCCGFFVHEASIAITQSRLRETKNVSCAFVFLWHNLVFNDQPQHDDADDARGVNDNDHSSVIVEIRIKCTHSIFALNYIQ